MQSNGERTVQTQYSLMESCLYGRFYCEKEIGSAVRICAAPEHKSDADEQNQTADLLNAMTLAVRFCLFFWYRFITFRIIFSIFSSHFVFLVILCLSCFV